MSEPGNQRQHALHDFLQCAEPCAEPGVIIEPRPGSTHLNLRGDPADAQFTEAVSGVLGHALPLQTNRFTGDELSVYWLGPDEWLLVDGAGGSALGARLEGALADQHHALVDLSGGQIRLRLCGERVRDLLAKGCTVDLHPHAFQPGHCAQTGLAKAVVLIALRDPAPTFDLIVRRSFADYLAQWLSHAGHEYGVHWVGSQP